MGGKDFAFLTGYTITEFINYSLCYYLIFGLNISKKPKKWLIAIAFVIGFYIILTMCGISVLESTYFGIITMSIIPGLLIEGEKKVRFGIYFFVYFGMSSIGVTNSFVLSLVLGIREEEVINNYMTIILCQLVPSFFLLVGYIILKMRGYVRQGVYLGKSTYALFYIGAICVFFIQAAFQELCKYGGQNKFIVVCGLVTSIASLVFLILIFWYSVVLKRELELREKVGNLERYDEMREEYFQTLILQDEKIRSFRHDVKAHLAALSGYCQEGKIEQINLYLKTISSEYFMESRPAYTMDKGADAIISSLCNRAFERGINIDIRGGISVKKDVSSFELCSIFYNLMQNAIEACEKLPSDTQKIIKINMVKYNDYNIISIINPVYENVNFVGGKIKTQKKDKFNHGIGTQNVLNIVKKHEGTVRFLCEGNMFYSEVVI